jgi:hypothetical protein
MDIFSQNLGLDELVDPEINDALGSDPEKAHHFSKGGHTAIFPVEGGNGFLDGLDGSFCFHGFPFIELSFYCQEVFGVDT